MNRKRLEHMAGILRDVGIAAFLGGAGDAALNPESGRWVLDIWGIGAGVAVLVASTRMAGLSLRREGG